MYLFNDGSRTLVTTNEIITDAIFKVGNTSNGTVAAVSRDTAVRLAVFAQNPKILYISNETNLPIIIWAVHPEAPKSASAPFVERQKLITLPSGKTIDWQLMISNVDIRAKTEFWVSCTTAASLTVGTYIELFAW